MTRWATVLMFCLYFCGCSREQLLIFIDTDALVASQLRGHEEYSPDAVIDTARIEVLGAEGEILDICERFAGESEVWPISFGVAPSATPRFLRVRLFRRALVETSATMGISRLCGELIEGGAQPFLSVPPAEIAIDRLALLPSATGVSKRLTMLLSLSCMGLPASFLTRRSCVDGSREDLRSVVADAPRHWEDDAQPQGSTHVGQSPLVVSQRCQLPPPAGVDPSQVVCIPGGFFIMGDHRLTVDDAFLAPQPMRPVYLSPFYMDRLEYSVGRMKRTIEKAMSKGIVLNAPNSRLLYMTAWDQTPYHNCTWDLANYGSDQLPVNCISVQAAQAACRFDGGDLTTEAQWEHAARGRGRRWSYAWGNLEPGKSENCCKSSIGRLPFHAGLSGYIPDPIYRCGEYGPAPVGAYDGKGCAEGGDVSLDGVLDLTGNVSEYMRDDLRAYQERCGLQAGISYNPVCQAPGSSAHVARGGSWNRYDGMVLSALRWRPDVTLPALNTSVRLPSVGTGFRCVYPGE